MKQTMHVYSSNQTRPLITCRLFGQLGNQIYEIAAALAYAWDYQAIPIFPELNKTEDRIAYNRDRIFFRLDASFPPRPFLNVFSETAYYSPKRIPFRKDLIINGYFQSWKHFDHHRDQIRSVLAPSEQVLKTLNAKYSDLLAHSNTVGLHVRTYSKHYHDAKLHQFIGFQYYREAMALFPTDSVFVVFSDRINWCKKQFPNFNKKFIFIDGNDAIDDLFLMSMMKHNIIGNSTFSWWAGYLNQNPEKIVVSPNSFRDLQFEPNFPPHDYFLPDWKLIKVDFNEPYPNDISSFDTQSSNG
jgi:hypothetical protein